MLQARFDPIWPFKLNWEVRYSDMQVRRGFIEFDKILDPATFVGDEDDGTEESLIKPISCTEDWRKIVPILVNEMTLQDGADEMPPNVFEVPPYEQAAFWLNEGCPGIYANWGVRGRGFGQYYISFNGGYVSINNEFTSKNTILAVLQSIVTP